MAPVPIRTCCVDASVLIPYYTDECISEEVRKYLQCHWDEWYTTPFCFFEALSCFKRKHKRTKNPISADQYREAGSTLINDIRGRFRDIPGIESFNDSDVLNEVLKLCDEYEELDFSDAFQILSVEGKDSALWSGAKLVTADRGLADAA